MSTSLRNGGALDHFSLEKLIVHCTCPICNKELLIVSSKWLFPMNLLARLQRYQFFFFSPQWYRLYVAEMFIGFLGHLMCGNFWVKKNKSLVTLHVLNWIPYIQFSACLYHIGFIEARLYTFLVTDL